MAGGKRWRWVAVGVVAASCSVMPPVAAQAQGSAGTYSSARVIAAFNRIRRANGLPAITEDETWDHDCHLDDVYMADNNLMTHYEQRRARLHGRRCLRRGQRRAQLRLALVPGQPLGLGTDPPVADDVPRPHLCGGLRVLQGGHGLGLLDHLAWVRHRPRPADQGAQALVLVSGRTEGLGPRVDRKMRPERPSHVDRAGSDSQRLANSWPTAAVPPPSSSLGRFAVMSGIGLSRGAHVRCLEAGEIEVG